MAIQEELILVDGMSGALDSASSAASATESALRDVQSAADDIGSATTGAASSAVSSLGDTEQATHKVSDAMRTSADAARDAGEAAKEAGSSASDIAQVATGIVSAGKAALATAKKIAQVALQIGRAVLQAVRFRRETQAAFRIATGGAKAGKAAFEAVSADARHLGIDVSHAADRFVELSKAGAMKGEARGLIRLEADLMAVGMSADEAKSQVDKALEQIKGGKDAASVISSVADQFGVVGDGANAAAKRALTLEGAIANVRQAGARIMDRMAARAGPALDAVGEKLTSAFDSLEESGQLDAIIDGIGAAFEALPGIIDTVTSTLAELWDASKPVRAAMMDLAGSFGSSGDKGGAFSAIMRVLKTSMAITSVSIRAVAAAVKIVGAAIGAVIDVFGSAADAVGGFLESIFGAPGEIVSSIGEWMSAGGELVAGFVAGITGKVGAAIAAAKDLGAKAAGALKGFLGIASPSKLMTEYGQDSGAGYVVGIDDSSSDVESAMRDLGGAAMSAANDTMPGMSDGPSMQGGGSARGGGGGVSVTVNVTMGAGAGADEVGEAVARAVRGELVAMGLVAA